MIKKINFSCLLFGLSLSAFALVDYTEPEAPSKSFRNFKKKSAPSKAKSQARASVSRGGGQFLSLTPSLGYETKDLDAAKSQFYHFGARIQSSYGFFLEGKYWLASSRDSISTITDSGHQAGNLTTILGFNWLSFGDAATRMTLDLAFGAVWGNKSSEFASSRLDKVVRVSSSKRMHRMGLGLEYELRLVGDPKKTNEVAIGNIHKLSAVIGFVATSDISFELEGSLYRVSAGDSGKNDLEETISFSYLSPKLNLQLSPVIELQLGGRFRAERAQVTESLLGAKLWDLPGIYSNSIFANLNISV